MRSPTDQERPNLPFDLPPSGKKANKSKANYYYMLVIAGLIALVGIGLFATQLNKTEAKPDSRVAAKISPTATLVITTPTPVPTVVPEIKVYVTGEVKAPGVYPMQPNDRLEDAIKAAGGFTDEADKVRVDLAMRVRDEMQIIVPKLASTSSADNLPAVSGGNTPLPGGGATTADGKININKASAAELDKLPGIGEVLSARIVEYRTKNGPFKTLDDLRKVAGITKAVVDKIKDLIVF